jgi:two-component system, LytTR family, sensor kinase
LDALSLRLRPHFLFNALNTISSTVYQDPVAADDLIGRLGELLRRTLHTDGRQEIPLAEELDVLRSYQALVEARFGDRIGFTIDVEPRTTALAVPAFLLQPLVENAVHHGLTAEYDTTHVVVTASREGADLRLSVENDAPDRNVAVPREGTGLGTTRDRLRLLYGTEASLDTVVRDGRFRVTVRLPAREAPAIEHPDPTIAGAHR